MKKIVVKWVEEKEFGYGKALRAAMQQRDEYDKWCVDTAKLLGVRMDDLPVSMPIRDQYAEVRKRITDCLSHVDSRPSPSF